MAHDVCPWWLGYFLITPLRRLLQDPRKIVGTYVRERMIVLEPGPGMGFFTLELGRSVGPSGRVVAVDIQPRMLSNLKRRAARAGLLERLDARLATPNTLGIEDLAGTVDFTLAFALVHELPAAEPFFRQAALASKKGAGLLFVEPAGHVKPEQFAAELDAAVRAGFAVMERPTIGRSHAAFLKKT
jgi:SAM-dependent methyltransferase